MDIKNSPLKSCWLDKFAGVKVMVIRKFKC